MPTYEYRCRTCGEVFEERRAMAESSAPATCPAGHPHATRVLSVFSTVNAGERSAPATPCGAACACHPG